MGRVDIVIPTHNCGEFLPRAVESVLQQTHRDWQLYIVDDGSTDGTQHYLQSLRHPAIHVIRNEQAAGPAVARNQGVLASKSEYVAFLDADDEWAAEKLERQLELFREDPDAVLCFTDYERLHADGKRDPSAIAGFPSAAQGMVFDNLLKQNFVLTSSVLVRRDALARSGLFDHRLRYCQDYDLWLRVARVGRFRLIKESLSTYRLHGDNNVFSHGYAMLSPLFLELAIGKHSDAAEAKEQMRPKLGRAWHLRARTAMHEGDFAVSRRAFWRAARYGHTPFKSLLQAGFSLMPSFISRTVLSGYRKLKNVEPQRRAIRGMSPAKV